MNSLIKHYILLPLVIGIMVFIGFEELNADSQNFNKQEHPNIVLFDAYDLGTGDIEPYDNQEVRTPHLDQLTH